MTSNFNATSHLNAMEKTMGLSIKAEWKEMVTAHLENAAKMANQLNNAPLLSTEFALANTYTASNTTPKSYK